MLKYHLVSVQEYVQSKEQIVHHRIGDGVLFKETLSISGREYINLHSTNSRIDNVFNPLSGWLSIVYD